MFLKLKKKKILLVDDEKDFLMTIKFYLESKGYDVITAYNGKDAIENLKESPDLILMDLKLPDMDGYEVCRRIRLSSHYKKTPMVMLTCSTDTKFILESQDEGISDYLMKTVEFEQILRTVKKYA